MKTNRHFSSKNLFLFHLLKTQHRHKSNQEQGYILVIALGIVVALSGLMALYAKTNNKSEKETTTAAVSSNSGFYGAEAQLNTRANKLREKFLDYGKPKGTSPTKADACFDKNSSNDGTLDYICEGTTISSNDPAMSDTLITTYVTEKNGGEGVQGKVPAGDAYQGLSMLEVGHSIYALAFKDDINNKGDGKQATAIIQMDVKSRLIPMFQFAAFYVDDLEIFPGAAMTLSGPIHTNGDLFMGSAVSLDVKGQITTVKDIYARRKHNSTTFDGAFISTQLPDTAQRLTTGSFLKNLLLGGTGSSTKTPAAMNPTLIAQNWGSQIKVKTDAPISIPQPSILNINGDYYDKADIRIKFKPVATSPATAMPYLNTVPFEITAIDRKNGGPTVLTEAQRKSLRQPIMVGADLAAIPAGDYKICTPDKDFFSKIRTKYNHTALETLISITGTTAEKTEKNKLNWWIGLTAAKKNAFTLVAQDNIQKQIQSQTSPVLFSTISSIKPTDMTGLTSNITLTSNFTSTEITDNVIPHLQEMTASEIAGLQVYNTGVTGKNVIESNTARCFVAAPILEVGRDKASDTTPFRYYNVREGRDMRLLQLNIQSLAIWNRDGVYLNSGTLTSAANLLYARANPDTNAPANSFQSLGLAAVDDTQGGMVVHATVDDSATTSKAVLLQSPYGFAFINGKQLFGLAQTTTYPDPTGLTIASDQAIYQQGNYNTVNKQPASILADSFNPLSNACLNNDRAINHHGGTGCNIDGSANVAASDTTFNAAILSGTDVSVLGQSGDNGYNGGLENYPRFAENWSGKTWTYRGSFVSISKPLYVSGNWKAQAYNPPNRNWDYDTDFNDPNKLPPLTPQFVVLKQESFIRSFDQ